jgi:hypothetical protein
MRITAFKLPKPKKFDYNPLYYNADKERREERERRINRDLEMETSDHAQAFRPMSKEDISHAIRFRRPERQKAGKSGMLVRVITIILALLVALFVLYGTYVLVKVSQ